MNADFEMELGAAPGTYRRPAVFEKINRRLASHLLWLAAPGDALLLEEAAPAALLAEAEHRGVVVISTTGRAMINSGHIFTPWGWTANAAAVGRDAGAIVRPVPPEIVARVNSKLWSHQLELELGIAMPGARTASSFEELEAAVTHGAPRSDDKWVIKAPFGFAARERVLGRGPRLEGPPATWSRRRFQRGETLIFQPWLKVIREYGVAMQISSNGELTILGASDLQTNRAGTGVGYLLGRALDPRRLRGLAQVARIVGGRLFEEGYTGPAGFDALEHEEGLHPLLEINARYTMGFVALAVERTLNPTTPTFWSMK